MNAVRADFDRIALLPETGFDHNARYHGALLKALPRRIGHALDLGCGTGRFSRLLASRADRVTAIDLSANMIDAARAHSAASANIDFLQADALKWNGPEAEFDAIVSIATLHHLPMDRILPKMKAALKPGGVIAILDLRRCGFWANALGLPWSIALNLLHTGRLREDEATRRAWAEHGKTDRYLSLGELRQITAPILPGAEIRRRLLWRYTLIWRNSSPY